MSTIGRDYSKADLVFNSAYELIQKEASFPSLFSLVAIGNILSQSSLNLKSDFRAWRYTNVWKTSCKINVPVRVTTRYSETGVMARQVTAVMATMDDTSVFVSVVAKKEAKLQAKISSPTVNYQERTYAAGKIPGGFLQAWRSSLKAKRQQLVWLTVQFVHFSQVRLKMKFKLSLRLFLSTLT